METHIDLKSSGHYDDSWNKIIKLAVVQFHARGRHSGEYAAYRLLFLFNGLRQSRKIPLCSYVNSALFCIDKAESHWSLKAYSESLQGDISIRYVELFIRNYEKFVYGPMWTRLHFISIKLKVTEAYEHTVEVSMVKFEQDMSNCFRETTKSHFMPLCELGFILFR
jgi:hypothetical protein